MKLIGNYLKDYAQNNGDKIAYIEGNNNINYRTLYKRASAVADLIGNQKRAILVYLDKSIDLVTSIAGVLMTNNYYIIGDTNMPLDRLEKIIDEQDNLLIITNKKYEDRFNKVLLVEEIGEKDDSVIKATESDIAYMLYTSGSTGSPKGTMISHKALMNYLNWFKEAFNINDQTIFASATQGYFSMSISDLIGNLYYGTTTVLIPKIAFSFPKMLVDSLTNNHVNTIYWTPSMLKILYNSGALEGNNFSLEKILFAGEVMPTKLINAYKKYFKDIMYANLFGPTETVDICTYYILDREFKDEEKLPIGIPCSGVEAIIYDNELYIKCNYLANGYYKNEAKTKEAFVQNPLHNDYEDIVYKTGDLVHKEEDLLYFDGRSDFQIKRKGYRIELEEIEKAAELIVDTAVCVYDLEKEKIHLFINEDKTLEEMLEGLRKYVPLYMDVDYVHKIDKVLYNANGKKDRNFYKNEIKKEN